MGGISIRNDTGVVDTFSKEGRNRAELAVSSSNVEIRSQRNTTTPLPRCSSLAAPFHDAARATVPSSFCSLPCRFRNSSGRC